MIQLSLSLVASAALLVQEPPRFLPTLAGDASIVLQAAWEPCRRSKYGLFAGTEVLRSPRPAEGSREYRAAELAPLLPHAPVAVGETWPVEREAVLPFLRQLHPGARTTLRHYGTYAGTFACLRAASERELEILFRAHAEFELEGGVFYTPAQFEGRLVLARESGRPLALRIALPDRDTNVDVNVPMEAVRSGAHEASFLADIGWVPRMELAGGAPEEREWSHSIPDVEARARLARRFYPFARLDWLPFDLAVTSARELGKPLHVVVLFGALDDESC